MKDLLKNPSAWIPLIMSLAAFLLVIIYILIIGTHESQADEGLAVRIYQLLLVGQVPVILFFAIQWLSKKPKETAKILAIQILAIIIAFSIVFFLEL